MRKLWGTTTAALAVLALVVAGGGPSPLRAQQGGDRTNTIVDPSLLDGLTYRSLDFSRGGRSTAVAGVPSEPSTFYFGSTGGGVWKTTDGGLNWHSITDGQIDAGGIGAIAVADSDPNVIYVGTGSACPRGNISAGVGMYKSLDAGKTWSYIGLCRDCQIGHIRVHPKDSDLVYAAVLGNMFGPSQDRGVYRSKDGGATWEKVLYVNERTGRERPLDGRDQPADPLRRHVGGAAPAVDDRQRQHGRRHLQVHRRRRPLDEAHQGAADRRAGGQDRPLGLAGRPEPGVGAGRGRQ